MWDIEGGIVHICETYFGKNGRKCCTKEGLEPFTKEELEKGFLAVDSYPKENIRIFNDWIILENARLAYHKKGTIAMFIQKTDYGKVLQNINTDMPIAIVYSPSYIRYVSRINTNGKVTEIITTNPEKSMKLFKKYYEYTGVPPRIVTEDYAEGSGNNPLRYTGKGFVIPYGRDIILSPDAVEPGELDLTRGEEVKKLNDKVAVTYIFGTPIVAVYNYNGVQAVIKRKNNEKTRDFIEKAQKLAKIDVVPGKAPYRAEIYPWNYYAWAKIGDDIIEFTIPYGYTIKNAEFVREKCGVTFDPNIARAWVEKYKKQSKNPIVIRNFGCQKVLMRIDDEYYINEMRLGKFNTLEEALNYYSKIIEEKSKEGARKIREEYEPEEKVPIVKVYTNDIFNNEFTFYGSEENIRKIKKIISEIEEIYAETPIQVTESKTAGTGYVPKIVKDDCLGLARKIEEVTPGMQWMLTPSGEFHFLYEAYWMPSPELYNYIINELPSFEDKYEYFKRRAKELKLKKVSFEEVQSFEI